MKNSDLKSKTALGFLTVIEDLEHGLFGGYLLLNVAGRPLEFHCTAPIKPNRAQQILYGPTLEPYLFGEQIGQTLFEKAKTEPVVLCTDREPALAIRSHVSVPVLLVLPEEEKLSTSSDTNARDPAAKSWRLDPAHRGPTLVSFQLGRNRVAVPEASGDRTVVIDRLAELAESFDLAEPFARIREAIDESAKRRLVPMTRPPAPPPTAHSRHPAPPPATFELDLAPRAQPHVTGWNRALSRPPEIEVRTVRWSSPVPRVVSMMIEPEPIATRSFIFDEPAQAALPPASPSPSAPDTAAADLLGRLRTTRIKPPGDVIKLEDRLNYLLQPSLESILTERSLQFPFQPFGYQLEGIAFLYPRHAAILADEMGLGKTMQAITTIRLLLRSGEVQSVLLICPKPLVSNWQREFELWAPELPLLVIEGDQARRRWQWQLAGMPVKIANYEILRRDLDVIAGEGLRGSSLRFDLVVLDESQRIKNRASATSEATRSIRRGRSWALTGTPVENSPEDLVGIFEFLAPGFLSPEMKPRRMGQTISDYVIRRTKDQVLTDLPPKLFRDAELELTPEQRQSYIMAEEEGVLRLTEMGDSATIQHVFELVLRLKQICNFDPATGESAKLERLEADLEEVATSGRKAIVFSQWVETLRRLAGKLHRFGPLEYHGRVPSSRRDAVIRQFRDDPNAHVILMSYGAGGVGLNLQFTNYVFLFDRWWNPAVEDQAINRAHRIGVSGPVTVSRFLTLETIEERIDRVLQEKRELFDTIFSGAEGPRKLGLTQEELFGLFRLKSPGGAIDQAA